MRAAPRARRRDANHIVFDGHRPFGSGAPDVREDLLDRRIVARPEEARVVDKDDVVPDLVAEDVGEFGPDRRVGGAARRYTAREVAIEPKEAALAEAGEHVVERGPAVSLDDRHMRKAPEALRGAAAELRLELDRDDAGELALDGCDHVAEKRPRLDERPDARCSRDAAYEGLLDESRRRRPSVTGPVAERLAVQEWFDEAIHPRRPEDVLELARIHAAPGLERTHTLSASSGRPSSSSSFRVAASSKPRSASSARRGSYEPDGP